jgi:hypothetical protein
MRVAALYVDSARGAYVGLPGVDVWGWATRDGQQIDAFAEHRDARLYAGPYPVVAHPPCGPWGRYRWNYGGGEGDALAGVRAVDQVRTWGGVLEHPSHSLLWAECALPAPGEPADRYGGRTVAVQQCDWGHRAQKPTWLYIVGSATEPPYPPAGVPTHCITRVHAGLPRPELPKRERHLTPVAFARWLVELARSCAYRTTR